MSQYGESDDYLFPSTRGGRITERTFHNIMKRCAFRAGLYPPTVYETTLTEKIPEEQRIRPHVLRHTHLPMLADAGLIIRDHDDSIVETATHLAFDDPRFRLLLEAEVDGLDDALSNLAVKRRRVLLTVLRDAQTSMTRRDLAREILHSDKTDLDPDRVSVNSLITALYHVHLPVLDDAGFVDYDRETDRATYLSHSALEEVFTIIYEPDERLVDSYDGFFAGLEAAYKGWRPGAGTEAEWPRSWGDPAYE